MYASIGVVVCEAPMGIVSAFFPRKFVQRNSSEDIARAWFDDSIFAGQEVSDTPDTQLQGMKKPKVTQAELRALFKTRLQRLD